MEMVYKYAEHMETDSTQIRDSSEEERLEDGYYLKRVSDADRFCQFPNS